MPQQHQQQQGSKTLSRANSYYSQGGDENGSSSATGSTSAGFSSFFGGGKRKKSKNNITKTNSTFVAKITTHENLAKILANRTGEDVYLFWNTGRTFTWSDLGQKPNEPLSHISFSKAFPTSHDVNILTRSCDHLDVIIGFSTGDIMWFDPLCNKYFRLNKQAIIKDSAVAMIKWMPGSESQFMVAFHDGSILVMDKERDDTAFSVPVPPSDNVFHVTRPKHNKHNPVSHWQVSSKPITAFAFSPDLQHVAVVSMDGNLRIIDLRTERLLDTFSSYFGALKCVSWSPDGKYILTGGQDDLVTIWSFRDQKIVARCQGHQSYVTGVAFDPWRCDERNYRFGSVGEDAKLLLWDFSVGALHKPKAVSGHVFSSSLLCALGILRSYDHYYHDHGFSSLIRSGNGTNGVQIVRPPEPRSHVAMLQPMMSKNIHVEPLSGITFREDAIMTSDRRGHVRVWKRPPLIPQNP
ncbi:MAG: WD40-repeat-containing domain protein [Benniella sp.]|nr:MAG: WD40-repeat-containing domain protein [Benniella sp.]